MAHGAGVTLPARLPPAALALAAVAGVAAGPAWLVDVSLFAYLAAAGWWVAVSARPSGSLWRGVAILWIPAVPALAGLAGSSLAMGQADDAAFGVLAALAVAVPVLVICAAGSLVLVARSGGAEP